MRNAIWVPLFWALSVFAGPADEALGGRELIQLSATVAGLKDFDGGRAELQQGLEKEYPIGAIRVDVAGRLADAYKGLRVPTGFRTSLVNYDNSIYLKVDRTIGRAVARLAIQFSFGEQGHLTTVLSMVCFETSRDVCVWPEGTGGPVWAETKGRGEGPAPQRETPAPKP